MSGDRVPVHAYAGRHRGEPRTCAACGRAETLCADWHMFCDEVGRPIPTDVAGRHRAPGPALVGP